MFVTRIFLRAALLLFGQRKRICIWHLEKRRWDTYQGYLPCELCAARRMRVADFFYHLRHRSVRFLLREVDSAKARELTARQRLPLHHHHKPTVHGHNLPAGLPLSSIHE